MFAYTHACTLLGTHPVIVRVEGRVEPGLPNFMIIGLREADAREARERTRCALASLRCKLPPQRVTINLSPAEIPKSGAGFDLAIILVTLALVGEIPPAAIARAGAHAEVGLDGSVRPVAGTMAAALAAARTELGEFLVSAPAAGRAAHASIPIRPVSTLAEVANHLRGKQRIEAAEPEVMAAGALGEDLVDVRGQELAVSALTIAAAGTHNLLFYGSPGCGKTMIASRLPGILPPLQGDEALEVATIHDAAGVASSGVSSIRPMRTPHHNISSSALIGGGGTRPVVGELALAHRGVLFLDELPEFRPSAIDALRQPLEDGHVLVRRANWMVRYPAKTQIVAAMNQCRCGGFGHESRGCKCSESSRAGYLQRVSGAILDRFDLLVRIARPTKPLSELPPAPASALVAQRVAAALGIQWTRWGEGVTNAKARAPMSDFQLASRAQAEVRKVAGRRGMGGREQMSIVRVARTIADLEGRAEISVADVAVAVSMSNRSGLSHG